MKKITTSIYPILIAYFLLFSIQIQAQSIAIYDISVTTIWNSTDHTSVPGSAHWSNLIGATHSTADEFVSLGTNATLGIKDVAERGDNTEITNEINAAISSGDADQLLQDGFSPFAGNNSMAGYMNITVSESFPLITLVSMVAPSPDWFIAVNSLSLRSGNPAVNNGWKDTFTMDVFAYDAGTDDGTDYTSGDSPNAPVPVSMITGFPINGNKMATITFTFVSSALSTDEFTSLNDVKIYPNPSTTDELNILAKDYDNLDYSIVTILGQEVQKGVVNSNQINVSRLSTGTYFLQLNDGISATVKRFIKQ